MPVETVKKGASNRGRNTKFDEKVMTEALLLLQRNNFKYTETSKQLNVSKQLLRVWHDKYGATVLGTIRDKKNAEQATAMQKYRDDFEKTESELEILKHARKIQRNEGDIINAIYLAKLTLMDKVLTLAKNSKSLRDVAYALDIVQKAQDGFVDKDLENEFERRKTTFMDFVKQQYGDVPKENDVTGLNEGQDFMVIKEGEDDE